MSVYPFKLVPRSRFSEFLILESAILPHELAQINQIWESDKSHQAELEGDKHSDDTIRKSSVIGISPNEKTSWIFGRLTDLIHQVNQVYQFDIKGFYEPLQLAEYAKGDFFDWHLDFGTGNSSNRKLSITMQVSDPTDYEGGDLEFQINNRIEKAPREMGTVVVFPSFIMHRVTPITKGKRRSLVGWVSGPPFR